ncbi:MAG: ribonuclease R [Candidatus Merdivicinus sp.]|jgi:ribonuclease R
MEKWMKRILLILDKAGKKGLSLNKIQKKCKVEKGDLKKFQAAVSRLLAEGQLIEKNNHYLSVKALGLLPARIQRLHKTYGFAALADGQEVFILGSRLMGSLPGDQVLIRLSSHPRGNLPEGEVCRIVKESKADYAGRLQITENGAFFLPDMLGDFPLRVMGSHLEAENGDKVLARIIRRGDSHRNHLAEITACFGSSDHAAACAKAVLAAAGVSPEFPAAVLDEAHFLEHRGIPERELLTRLDLRDTIIFTIDGADSKDLDDAVSLEKYNGFYHLGVHIADVSHYVKSRSLLDEEAFARGTSIYYADQVIPMLPAALSNGICSLNPQEERLTFSALLTLSPEGELLDFTFRKSVIRSRVKGVYTEVNALLDGSADESLRQKYQEVLPMIPLMKELKDLRLKLRKQRGAPELDSPESKLILDDRGKIIDVMPRVSGEAESIIEEFMLLANEAAATLARKLDIPFVYRVHEHPDPERIGNLRETLRKLGLSGREIPEKVKPADLAAILEQTKLEPFAPVINKLVLRSMAKARYSDRPLGHFGLVLENYAHFTSPIRRYPDLTIHRILTSWAEGDSLKELHKKYERFSARSAEHSSETELQAMDIERSCEDCYKAEFMRDKIGQEFDGMISSVTSFGIYVELPSTVEGLVRLEDLPDGEYFFDGLIELSDIHGGRKFRLGDPVRVRCIGVDVNAGNIDFALV